MKQLFIIGILSIGLLLGCGNRNQNAHAGHDHEATETLDHEGHEHGPACDGKHDDATDDHDGHDHAAEGHDHSAESAQEHAAHSHEDEGAHAGEIVFTKAQAAAATDFALYEVQPVAFHGVIPASGQILAAQGDEATVVASFSGIISLPAKKLVPGAPVSKGETLFYVSSKEIAEGDYATRTEAAYLQAKAAYQRAQALIGDKIISQAEYDTAKTAYETALAAREALGSKVTKQGTAISSPLGGFIKNLSVAEGQYVEVGQPLATVSQNRRLVLQAEVSQRYHSQLGSIQSANFLTPYNGHAYSLSELNGRLLSVGKASDGRTAYLPVSFEFDNQGNVLPGSFVEIYLIGSPMKDVLTVPVSALTEEQGNYFVYVQLDAEGYRRQQVTLGANDGKSVQVLSGLHAGDIVVSQGATLVKMASFSGAIPHGHSH